MAKRVVAVTIAGQEYKLRSDADEAWLHRVAAQVDRAMKQIREHTRTVDSHSVAILTALNLAREVMLLREARDEARANAANADDADDAHTADTAFDPERMRALIELVEGAAAEPAPIDAAISA